jgi:pyrimidine and pyridine-specific 5'-nucleotidase
MIIAYIVSLGLSDEEASELHLRYYTQYGLAIRGLRRHYGVGSAIWRFLSRNCVYFFPLDPLDYDDKCDASLPLEKMLSPDPHIRKLLEDIDRSKCRVWALTNAYRTVRPTCMTKISAVCRSDDIFNSMQNAYCGSWSYRTKSKASYFVIMRRKVKISVVSPSLHSTIRSASLFFVHIPI